MENCEISVNLVAPTKETRINIVKIKGFKVNTV